MSGCWPGARPPPPPLLPRPPAASPLHIFVSAASAATSADLQPPASRPGLTSPEGHSPQPRAPASVTSPRPCGGAGLGAASPRVPALAPCPHGRVSRPLRGDVASSAAAWRLLTAVCAVAGNSGRLLAASPARTPYYLAARTRLLRNTADTGHITAEYWITLSLTTRVARRQGIHPLKY